MNLVIGICVVLLAFVLYELVPILISFIIEDFVDFIKRIKSK